ncbi:glycosyl hydrolase [Aurantibacter sp.]|uniref:glycosyl hydrolase n=1 Tax=Aurantibacter sp. TaxID=2807103 RepID=UPI0035C79183
MKIFVSILAFFTLVLTADAQRDALKLKELQNQSLVKNITFKNVGPTVMSGRVVDVDVNPNNPTEFYVAYASGGVWHTKNNGSSFDPILDNYPTQNVGDIAVHWKSKTIYVGTGENNSSRSSYAGIGVLKSRDNGKNWEHIGLPSSQHIGRILINPKNKDEVVIGVLGSLYTPNQDRGIYKTLDGGKTWNKNLFIDDLSGIIDVQFAPEDFNVMYAASWTKDRKAWNFNGNGNNSAIYKSENAGETWLKVSTVQSGFATGNTVGRIGLAVFNANTVYAYHDSQARRPLEDKETEKRGLVKEDFKTMSETEFLALTDKKLNGFLKTNDFQEKYRAQNVKQMVRSGNVKPIDLANYLEDANSMLFDTPVVGAEVYKTINGGKNWIKTHQDYLDDLVYSYGYYFGEIRVDLQNENNIYILGVPILKSRDAGKNFESISRENVHADHQALWVNPKKTGHLINGNDGGLNMSYDDGKTWEKLNVNPVGQFYTVNVDNEKPYNIYGGLQDNGVWVGSSRSKINKRWQQSGENPFKSIMGGDGMQIQIDTRNSNIVYTGYQFGNYYRINRETDKQKYIQPKHKLGEKPYRFNWQTPILLSSHNQDILYLGGNKLMRSLNQGEDWEAISEDLTKGGKKGNVAYGTLTTISESPFQFGLIYTGSDDGLIQVTKNTGATWTVISNNLPKDLWVSRIVASQHKKERVYVTLNGYRNDNFKSYIYVSEDYGANWKVIDSGIAKSPVNVIKEDLEKENILYLGTDNAAYVSFNKGEKWYAFSKNLPAVAVHDLVLQKASGDLLLGTHGRSIYKTNIKALQNYSEALLTENITVFDIETISHSKSWGNSWSKWLKASEPSLELQLFSNRAQDIEVKVLSENKKELNRFVIKADKGFNSSTYNLALTQKGIKTLLKENTSVDIEPAKNGESYLPKGVYYFDFGVLQKKFEID